MSLSDSIRGWVRRYPALRSVLAPIADGVWFLLDIPRRVRARLFGVIARVFGGFAKFFVESIAVPLGRFLSSRRLAVGKPRSLWGTTPILTLSYKARCDRSLGFQSESVVFTTYSIFQNFDVNFQNVDALVNKRAPSLFVAYRRFVLAWMLIRYDIIHLFADRGVMPSPDRIGIDPWEMDQIRRASKRFYVYCYGADVRTRERTLALGKWNFCIECPRPGELCICDESKGRANIAAIESRANAIISLGDMLSYVPKPVHLDYWPIDVDAVEFIGVRETTGPLKIAHVPNHAFFKGSRYLAATVEDLRAEGHQIELTMVSGVPHSQVLEIFAECDVIADQFIGGAYGYTALEGMARGKPVITYVRSAALVQTVEECPFINTNPDTLREALLWILRNRAKLPALGRQGRAYVEKWHSMAAVSERLGQLYENTASLPSRSLQGIRSQRESWLAKRGAIPDADGWQHPWQVPRP